MVLPPSHHQQTQAIAGAPANSATNDGGQTTRMGTDTDRLASKPGMDDIEREAIRVEGLDPDDQGSGVVDLRRRDLR